MPRGPRDPGPRTDGDAMGASTGGRTRLTSGRIGGLAGLLAALVVLAPWWAPGALLVRDLVAVPDPAWAPSLLTGGLRLARDVPGEVVTALVGQLVGADVVVRLALLGAAAGLGAGVGRLLPHAPPVAVAVAAVAAVVNPWTWAHLRAGQWLVVVALATVPWVGAAVAADDRVGLVRALVVAAVSGFLAVVVVWPTVVAVGVTARRWRALALGLATGLVGALPWMVLGGPGTPDPDGFRAFAANADVPWGTWVSLVSGGGYFNATIASPWRATMLLGGLATLLALLAAGAAVAVARRDDATARRALRGLAVAGAIGLLVAGLGATGPGLRALASGAELVPGLAVLRDTHRLLAAWVVVLAVGTGHLVAWAGRRLDAPWAVAAAGVLVVVLALPDPLVGPRLPGPSAVPDAWTRAAAAVDADPRPGVVLAVPHGQTQQYAFTDGRPVAMPFRRMVARPVAVATTLRVGDLVVADDPAPGPWAGLASAPAADWDAERFAAAGVAWVVVTDATRLPADGAPTGFTVEVDAPTLALLRVAGVPDAVDVAPSPWLVALDTLLLVMALGALAWPRRRWPGAGEARELVDVRPSRVSAGK